MIGIILFCIFALLSGNLEAYFWAAHPDVSQRWSHISLTVIRAIVASFVFICGKWTDVFVCMLVFPMIHDGMYYHTRNFLNPKIYTLGWMDHSTKTGAMFSLPFVGRLIFAIIGVILFIYA